ncbi:hypothetical protein U9M48_040525 [Paspalum notatum var. saurae]|uniref:Uncharacterized protein n=1 Tax=Paspalum notatum var. saurae TaxID=547442 RepID=A0AAQ3USI8_PASNO
MTLLHREWNQLRASNQAEIALKMEHQASMMSKSCCGIVNAVAVSSIEAETVGLKASSPCPFLVIVHIKDSVIEP